MVPRINSNSPGRQALNSITEHSWGEQQLVATPTNIANDRQSDENDDSFEEEEEEEENIPVTEDNLQVCSGMLFLCSNPVYRLKVPDRCKCHLEKGVRRSTGSLN